MATATARPRRARIGRFFVGATHTAEELYQEAVRLHKTIYWVGVPGLIALVAIEVVLNYTQWLALGIPIINTAVMLILGFYATAPITFITLFGGGAAWKLLQYNWSWKDLLGIGKKEISLSDIFPDIKVGDMAQEGWGTYITKGLQWPAHLLILAIANGTVLSMLQVHHPTRALVLYPALVGIGLWSFALGGGSKWYRKITIAILVAGVLVSLHQVFAEDKPQPLNKVASKIISYFSSSDEWEHAGTISCEVRWNENLGWCESSEVGSGTYRVVPQYGSWQWYLVGGNYMDIPPQGVSLERWSGQSFFNDFQKGAPQGKNRQVGSLLVRVGQGRVIDPLQEETLKLKKPSVIYIGVNLPPIQEYFQGNRGTISVEIEKLVETE